METALRFDHAVILVMDLDKASADYRELGFNVFYGGQHADGKTHNALIVFGDGTYLELLAPTDPTVMASVDPDSRSGFLFMFAHGEGFGGYALLSADLQTDVEAMRKNGLKVQLRPPGGRKRPDGQELRWRSAMIESTMTPFFIQDETPRQLRVPNDPDKTLQPNGVTGVAGIMVASADLSAGIQRYSAILGENPQQLDATSADFALGAVTITVVVPTGEDSHLSDYLRQRGETPYKLWLWTEHKDTAGTLDGQRTHGAQIELMA